MTYQQVGMGVGVVAMLAWVTACGEEEEPTGWQPTLDPT